MIVRRTGYCALFAVMSCFFVPNHPALGAEESKASENPLSFESTVTFPSSYVFRGYVIEEDHFLVQPEFTLGYATHVADFDVKPYLNVWTNFTDASAPGDPEWFNEIDLTLGVEISLPHDLTLAVSYVWYTSPANAFDDIHEIGLALSHEDILHPSIGIFREINHQNGDENTYIELSLTPGFDVPNLDALRLDFPLVLGLTPDEYYTDSDGDGSVFGYASAGVSATYTLNENWSIGAGVDLIAMLSDSTEAANDGDDYQLVGTIGVTYSN